MLCTDIDKYAKNKIELPCHEFHYMSKTNVEDTYNVPKI